MLCITHLPQIAIFADRHLTVRKEVVGEKTATSVRVVAGIARVEELAEMIGGQRITATTRAQAKEMLEAADAPKIASAPKARTTAKTPARKLRA